MSRHPHFAAPMPAGADRSLLTPGPFRAGQGVPLAGVEAERSVTIRVLAPAAGGQRCHFLVQWRDRYAIQHGRTFIAWQEAAGFDAAIKAGRLPRDGPDRRAAVTFGEAAARWLATKLATKRPRKSAASRQQRV